MATRYHWLVRACARPYFLIGGDTEDLMQEGMFGLIKAMREFDPARSSLFRPFAGLCIHQQVCSALKRDASQKNAPLNQSVPLNPSLLNASPTFAQVDPELLLIDREKAASLLENTRKQLSAFEEKILGLFLDGLAYCEIAETVGRPHQIGGQRRAADPPQSGAAAFIRRYQQQLNAIYFISKRG